MTIVPPQTVRTRRVYPTPPASQRASTDGSPKLMLGLFENLDQAIDTGLGVLIFLCLYLNFGFGSICILGFLAAFGLMTVRAPKQAAVAVFKAWPVMLLPIIALGSTAWSHYPDITIRGAIQLILTVIAAVIMAERLTARQFLASLFVASLATCLLCLAFPIQVETPDGIAFVGLMGSKNQLAFLAGTLILTSLTLVMDPKHLKIIRLGAAAGIVFGFGLVLIAKSAGGLVDAVSGCAIFSCVLLTIPMRRSTRAYLIAAVVILATPAVIMQPAIQKFSDNFIIEVLHKDPTLTGRTYLWERAAAVEAQAPLLGVGYNAFWVQGESDAEGLWAYAGITQRSGFNFHNQFVDIKVMLGWLGMAVLTLSFLYTLTGVGAAALIVPSVAGSCFVANVVVCLIRTFTESGLIQEFNFYLVIFTAAGLLSWKAVRNAQPAAETGSAPPNLHPRSGVKRERLHRPVRDLRRMQPRPERPLR